MRLPIPILMLTAALTACSSTKNAASLNALSGEWTVTTIQGEPVAGDNLEEPFLGFDVAARRVYGSTNCNRLTGTLSADAAKGSIDLGNMASTRMMCHDMRTEDRLLAALRSVKTFRIDSLSAMQLADESGKTIVELKRKK